MREAKPYMVTDYYKDYSLNSSTKEEPKKEESKKEEVKANESATLNKTVASLKQAIVANQGQVKSAEFLLNELPKTVKGKEQKLIKMMRSAYDLQVESANLVKELTGEVIVVAPLRIPANLR